MDATSKYFVISLVTILRYFLLAGTAFVVFYKIFYSRFRLAKIQQRVATKKDFLREILHSLLSSFVIAFLGFLVLSTPLRHYTRIYNSVSAYPIWWMPVSFVASLVLHDTYFYWMHRLLHHKDLFSLAHIVHHQSTNPSPWTAYSFHLLEAITEGLIVVIIVFIMPIHISMLILFTLVGFIINVYGHLGFEIMPRWFRKSPLFGIVNTSVYHNMHHHKFKGNYGLYFRFWDKLLKTENPDYVKEFDAVQERRFGSKRSYTAISIIFVLLSTAGVNGQIEGRWLNRSSGDVVEIYKQGDLFYGKAVGAKGKSENEMLSQQQIIVLDGFMKKEDTYYGTIFLPRKKMRVDGTLTPLSDMKLEVEGKFGLIRYATIWVKI